MKKLTMYCLLSLSALNVNAGTASDELKRKQAACGEFDRYPLIEECHQNLLKESDVLLNKEYKELVGYLSGSNRKNLIDAQRKWGKFRDADCFFSEPRGGDGSIASANRNACLADRTIERLSHLEDYNAPSNKGCNGCPW